MTISEETARWIVGAAIIWIISVERRLTKQAAMIREFTRELQPLLKALGYVKHYSSMDGE